MKRRGLFGWIDAIPPALRRIGEPRGAAWSLPAGAFDHATRQYLLQANEILKKLGVSPKGRGGTR